MSEYRYSTTRIDHAALCMSYPGIKFQGIEPSDDRTLRFLFTPRSRCQKLIDNFSRGTLRMNIRQFCDGQRMARDILFGSKRGELGYGKDVS